VFSGVDARWMRGGVQLRGEWLDGRPFDGMHTRGAYLDAFVHRPGMGPVTAVARIEFLDYDAGPRSAFAHRATVGARVHLVDALYAQLNTSHQSGEQYSRHATATDLALTYTLRFPR
jgi:hypothetical protein